MILPVISLNSVEKCFIIQRDQESTLKDWVLRFPKTASKPHREMIWVLRDINMRVMEGESIGIVGANGVGKSTLLRLMAKTLVPTKGKITIRGKVVPLLSLGLGFHQELTGQENLSLNMSLFGLSRSDIKQRYLDIVNFAEIGKYIDIPIKQYSTGMRMRLAFSIAVHLDPDILLVDEVLSVGDAYFREKCLNRMHELRQSNKTIVIVSHSANTIKNMCDRAFWLHEGSIVKAGDPQETTNAFQQAHVKAHESKSTTPVTL